MIYSIDLKDFKIDKTFIRLLLFKFKILCLSRIDAYQVKRINNDLYNLLGVEINYIKLLNTGVRNTKCIMEDDVLFFIIPNNLKYPKTDFKISDLLKITEFGTLQIRPYPIIRKTLSLLKKNIKLYLTRYKSIGWF